MGMSIATLQRFLTPIITTLFHMKILSSSLPALKAFGNPFELYNATDVTLRSETHPIEMYSTIGLNIKVNYYRKEMRVFYCLINLLCLPIATKLRSMTRRFCFNLLMCKLETSFIFDLLFV